MPITSPSDIPSLIDWGDDGSFSGLANNDPVVSWPGRDAVVTLEQSNASKQPLYKTNVVGTKAGVLFDGVDDFLESAANLNPGSAFALALVLRFSGNADDNPVLAMLGDITGGNPYNVNGAAITRLTTGTLFGYGTQATTSPNSNVRETSSAINPGSTTYRVILIVDRAAAQSDETKIYLNGTGPGLGPYGNYNLSGNFTAAKLFIGAQATQTDGRDYFKGHILGWYAFSSLSDSERQDLDQYLATYWAASGGGGGNPDPDPGGGGELPPSESPGAPGIAGEGFIAPQSELTGQRLHLYAANDLNTPISTIYAIEARKLPINGVGAFEGAEIWIEENLGIQPFSYFVTVEANHNGTWVVVFEGVNGRIVEERSDVGQTGYVLPLIPLWDIRRGDRALGDSYPDLPASFDAGQASGNQSGTSYVIGNTDTWEQVMQARFADDVEAQWGYGPGRKWLQGKPQAFTPAVLAANSGDENRLTIDLENEGYVLLDYLTSVGGSSSEAGDFFAERTGLGPFVPRRFLAIDFDADRADSNQTSLYTAGLNSFVNGVDSRGYFEHGKINVQTLLASYDELRELQVNFSFIDFIAAADETYPMYMGAIIYFTDNTNNSISPPCYLDEDGIPRLNVAAAFQRVLFFRETVAQYDSGTDTWNVAMPQNLAVTLTWDALGEGANTTLAQNIANYDRIGVALMMSGRNPNTGLGSFFYGEVDQTVPAILVRDVAAGWPTPPGLTGDMWSGPSFRFLWPGIVVPPVLVTGLPGDLQQYVALSVLRHSAEDGWVSEVLTKVRPGRTHYDPRFDLTYQRAQPEPEDRGWKR